MDPKAWFHIPMISQPAQAASAAHFAHSNLSPGNPILMDIDATQKARATPRHLLTLQKN